LSNEETNLEVVQPKAVAGFGAHGVELKDLRDAYQFAQYAAQSGLVPRGLDSPEKVLIAVQTGMEAGLAPMASVRAIYVVGGTPAWRGDAALGLLRASGQLDGFKKEFKGKPYEDDYRCVVTLTRGKETSSEEYSVDDAKTAKLWGKKTSQGKDTPWITAPKRMLYYRALGFAARDLFSDILMNLHLAEELQGVEAVEEQSPVAVHAAQPEATTDAKGDPKKDNLFEAAADAPGAVVDADYREVPEGESAASTEPAAKRDGSAPPPVEEALGKQDAETKRSPEMEVEETAATKDPPKPLQPYEKPARRSLRAMMVCLEHIEHPMKSDTVKGWDKEQREAAWEWCHRYATWFDIWNGAVPASADESDVAAKALLPKPSFIPEYGEFEAQPEYSHHAADDEPEEQEPEEDDWDALCTLPIGDEGKVCTMPHGHGGDCE